MEARQLLGYIDAGAGSLILQALLGALFAALFAVKVFGKRMAGFFSRLLGRGGKGQSVGKP